MPDMDKANFSGINRREFLQHTSLALGAAGLLGCADSSQNRQTARNNGAAADQQVRVAIVADPMDPIARSSPSQWAIGRLVESLAGRGVTPEIHAGVSDLDPGVICVIAAGSDSAVAQTVLAQAAIAIPGAAESLGLVSARFENRPVTLAAGKDARGLIYALTELADRVEYAEDPAAALHVAAPIVERPATRIRSMMKIFTSDVEDKGWYNDRDGWRRYLSMLAAERFNRFNLSFGIGYDFARNVKDAYFYFAYPFLLAVPGYDVRVTNLPDAERDRNLQMLRFISDEAAARGLHFQLGIWTHAYIWTDSPGVNHTIEGLTPQTHAPYCREALQMLLKECPGISGINFRIHGESGVPEGNYDFWKTVFDGIVQCGRTVEIDMHAKGMDQAMIDVALATGMPVNVDPKTWAEHMGLPYHQAGIRSVELPPPGRRDQGFFSRSSGSRSFLRYGYGDLLKEDRKYGVLHRTWPGTQRLLLWGDPEIAAAYANFANFSGSDGLELFEPLSFKGRKGSGLAGGRDAYADESLKTSGGDWEKYRYTYRLWGRLLYNPKADPQTWKRMLRKDYGPAADHAQAALTSASKILPLITTAHCPSAANNNYWPEIYTNMSIVDASRPGPYSDTPSPKRFGTVSPLDPEMFSRVDDFAAELLKGQPGGKYSPIEVAQWLIGFATVAKERLAAARKLANTNEPAFRRLAADVEIAAGLGQFFAHKFRSAVLWAIHVQSDDRSAAEEAVKAYASARKAWADFAQSAAGVYRRDITFGLEKQLRGHWLDRLAAIDADIAAMQAILQQAPPKPGDDRVAAAIQKVLEPSGRPTFQVDHRPPAYFKRGDALTIHVMARDAKAAHLHYRHVDQAELFEVAAMSSDKGMFSATIAAHYTDSPFPIQYYVTLHDSKGDAEVYPGLDRSLTRQPYWVVRQGKV